ncbi:hypothetical protein [Nannocystis bainbridge]|uniref:Uncharacterized protein n=1 Tax=Nannocystis bainbridge TaxID=2995303 RepID=A0ABT5DPH4_9BACT|nr:hypothetical protein [Nannocystis bainbridge]MDC0715557.1 hypothetical protein [Nannocystis bainbridge]
MRDGTIGFAEGAIDARTTRARFLEMHPSARLVTGNPPHRTYQLGPSAVQGRVFYAHVGFVEEALRVVRLAPAGGAASWDEVTDATLTADKRGNDLWLHEAFGLGPVTKLDWGTIASQIDRRTGGAFITIEFACESHP